MQEHTNLQQKQNTHYKYRQV